MTVLRTGKSVVSRKTPAKNSPPSTLKLMYLSIHPSIHPGKKTKKCADIARSILEFYAFGSSFATFFLNSLFFNLSASPSGCLVPSGPARWTFPPPPRPTWKFSFSMLGRRATSGMATSSFRAVAFWWGDPMLAAPPRPVLKAPSPCSPAAPSRTISPSP